MSLTNLITTINSDTPIATIGVASPSGGYIYSNSSDDYYITRTISTRIAWSFHVLNYWIELNMN